MTALRKFGTAFVGDIPWGTHLCQFYETKDDLIDILVPYFAEGLRNNEACMWVTSEPLEVEEATAALAAAVPNLDRFIRRSQLKIFPYNEWYLKDGAFDQDRVLHGWINAEANALKQGFDGVRLSGNTMWIERSLWDAFVDYEEAINAVIGGHRMLVLCTYSLATCSGTDVIDVVRNHEGTIIKQGGTWTVVEDVARRKGAEVALQQAHEELRIANEELQGRVQERTEELTLMNEELQSTNDELRVANEELHRETKQRTQAEKEARARAEQLQRAMTMVDLANDAIIVRDLDDHVTYWNRGAERLYGWGADEAAGQLIHRFLHTQHPMPLKEIGTALLDTGGWVGELLHTTKDKRRIWVESHQTLEFDSAGKPNAIFEINADITEYKQAEEELARELEIASSLARLITPLLSPLSDPEALTLAILDEAKHLTGSAHGFVALIDPHTKDVVAYGHIQMMLDECAIPHEQRQVRFPIGPNGRYHELWGYPLNEKKGFFTNAPSEHPASTGVPEGHARLEQFLAVPVLLGDEAVGEIALANPGRNYAQRDAEAVERLAEVFALTAARMQADERLRASSLYARNLIEVSPDPLVTISVEGKITDVNKATEEVTGSSRDELIGSDFNTYFTEPEKARAGYKQAFTDGFVRDYPLAIKHASGKVVDVLYNASVYRNEAGKVQGVFAAARDVTDRKRAEEELQRYSGHLEAIVEERTAQLKDAERLAAIGQTAAMIGHDLRNPLQGLQYIVDLQRLRFERMPWDQRDSEEWKRHAQLLDKITEQIIYMDKIVDDLQDYARPMTLEPERVSIHTVIDDVLQVFPEANGVEIVTDLSDMYIMADAHFMRRAFSNLILNALQAMHNGGTLTIRGAVEGDSVAIHVVDTGVGVPHEMRDKLFSPLVTGKAKGTGLGLAVVKRIVDAHNGTISFESEEGKGTTFIITLPS